MSGYFSKMKKTKNLEKTIQTRVYAEDCSVLLCLSLNKAVLILQTLMKQNVGKKRQQLK